MTGHPDLFVDADRSGKFCRPVDPAYQDLIEWLLSDGYLVVCQSLIVEYHRAVQGSSLPTTLIVLLDKLKRQGRLRHFDKKTLDDFRIRTHVERGLRSNREDRDHLKVVLLSDRRLGISGDVNFCHDANNYPGFTATVDRHPSQVPYRSPR